MESVTKTYIINVRRFEDEAVFCKALETVSPYRRQKIALLKNEKDKNRSLGAAAAFNAALKEYGLDERMMEYDIGKQGKPYLRYNPELYFSLSHSGDYAICSIGGKEVGNDIERVRSGREQVAKRFFAKEELDWIHRAESADEIESRIFRIWTMKESFLKVTGRGMSLPLNEFAVMVEEGLENQSFLEAAEMQQSSSALDMLPCSVMEDSVDISIRQNVNDKTYYIKEYAMPDAFGEDERYKISVCSESMNFAPELSFCNLG